MLVAIDFDRTFTADSESWSTIIGILEQAGHRVICVTGRVETVDNRLELRNSLPMSVEIIFSGDEPKRVAAFRKGHTVNVWIDDRPERIAQPFVKQLNRTLKGMRR